MLLLNAVSIAPAARYWLANSSRPRVLHVFDRVCNLINERREVLSIVTPQIGNGPFNLIVENDVFFANHLDTQSPIIIEVNQINSENLTIDLSGARLWNPLPDWESLHANRDEMLSWLLSSPITAYKKRGPDTSFTRSALYYSTPAFSQDLPITDHKFPKSLISNFSSALANINISSAIKLTSQLAGLGIGLTPAGDDFILGAVLAAWIIHPYEVAKELAQEITETAAPLTTSLSVAWLRSAGKGEAGVLWHGFFDALISKDREAIQESVDALLAVGHTSGADALAGFIGTFVYWSGQVKGNQDVHFSTMATGA